MIELQAPTLQEYRKLVLDAFDPETGYYYHTAPHEYTNFIDGLAWVCLLAVACQYAGDTELLKLCVRYINILLTVGPDARNFAPFQVDDRWVKSETYPDLWYRPKPQSFAGPCAWAALNTVGVKVSDPIGGEFTLDSVHKQAARLRRWGWLFGHAVKLTYPRLRKWGGIFDRVADKLTWPRQHINSMWMAYFIGGEQPPKSMLWMTEHNPFFARIASQEISGYIYPDFAKWSHLTGSYLPYVTPLYAGKSSAWIFRRDPFKIAAPSEESQILYHYTPLAAVVGEYMQAALKTRQHIQ